MLKTFLEMFDSIKSGELKTRTNLLDTISFSALSGELKTRSDSLDSSHCLLVQAGALWSFFMQWQQTCFHLHPAPCLQNFAFHA
ncbi:MAG: hypothetical protein GY705_01275 [Bacteroidetes bacterium]|nr:hypothetical protein [Bacteroidota bacterium]